MLDHDFYGSVIDQCKVNYTYLLLLHLDTHEEQEILALEKLWDKLISMYHLKPITVTVAYYLWAINSKI